MATKAAGPKPAKENSLQGLESQDDICQMTNDLLCSPIDTVMN
jgi:hypothetical protein